MNINDQTRFDQVYQAYLNKLTITGINKRSGLWRP